MSLSERELRVHVDELLEEWDTFGHPQPLHQPMARKGKRFKGGDVARLTGVFGLVRHAHESVRSLMLLIDRGHTSTVAPLVRAAYESALTAAWLVQSEDFHGVLAFGHEHARLRSALQKDAERALGTAFRDHASEITDTDTSLWEGSYDSAQRFGQICRDLYPAGIDAYLYYRMLSGYSHATVRAVDLYFAPPVEGEPLPTYREKPDIPLPMRSLLFLSTASMVWSARAFSYLTQDKAHRATLRRRARLLGIEDSLQLSDEYRQRHAKRGSGRRS